MRGLLSTFVGLWPAGRLKNWVLNRLGHSIDPLAHVSPVLLLGSTTLHLAASARVGTLSAFRSVRLIVERNAEIGQLNWVSAAPFLASESESPNAGSLVIKEHASVTNRHYFDVPGGVIVERFATVAGVRSVFFTHGIDVNTNELVTGPIHIGEYSMVGSSVNVTLGSTVPAFSVVGMGATVVPGLSTPARLYTGTPAREKAPIDASAPYFTRTHGAVPPRRRSRSATSVS